MSTAIFPSPSPSPAPSPSLAARSSSRTQLIRPRPGYGAAHAFHSLPAYRSDSFAAMARQPSSRGELSRRSSGRPLLSKSPSLSGTPPTIQPVPAKSDTTVRPVPSPHLSPPLRCISMRASPPCALPWRPPASCRPSFAAPTPSAGGTPAKATAPGRPVYQELPSRTHSADVIPTSINADPTTQTHVRLQMSLSHIVQNAVPAQTQAQVSQEDAEVELTMPGGIEALAVTTRRMYARQRVTTARGLDGWADAVHSSTAHASAWLASFFSADEIGRLFAQNDMGCYVVERSSGAKFLESMPLYARVGMHLLFVDSRWAVETSEIEALFTRESVALGAAYDAPGPQVLAHIRSFVQTYKIPLDELLIKDLSAYPTFNTFFARKLAPGARSIDSTHDTRVITSPADCRLIVFSSVAAARRLWIKGQEFTLPALLLGTEHHGASSGELVQLAHDPDASIAICRLAPQDYHRFHAPFDAEIVSVTEIPGCLYTVNPQAVNEDLNVFTQNKRAVMLLHAHLGNRVVPVALVAVGALLVGAIRWSHYPGEGVRKGDELGWFQYGGSTVILVLPSGCQLWDSDLAGWSESSLETRVHVGDHIGRACSSNNNDN